LRKRWWWVPERAGWGGALVVDGAGAGALEVGAGALVEGAGALVVGEEAQPTREAILPGLDRCLWQAKINVNAFVLSCFSP